MSECGAQTPEFLSCTLDEGHDGQHEAWGFDSIIKSWPKDEAGS